MNAKPLNGVDCRTSEPAIFFVNTGITHQASNACHAKVTKAKIGTQWCRQRQRQRRMSEFWRRWWHLWNANETKQFRIRFDVGWWHALAPCFQPYTSASAQPSHAQEFVWKMNRTKSWIFICWENTKICFRDSCVIRMLCIFSERRIFIFHFILLFIAMLPPPYEFHDCSHPPKFMV